MDPNSPHSKQQPIMLRAPRLAKTVDRRNASGEAMVKLVDRIKHGEGERRSFRDRRASPRIAVGLVLEIVSGHRSLRYITNDLSTFGLSVRTIPTPQVGTRLTLRLFLPDEPTIPMALEGEVLGSLGDEGGLRLKFVNPPLDAVRRIHKLVK